MPSPKRERKILIDLDAQPMPLPDIVISDRPELVVDLGNLRQPSNIKVMAIGQGGIKAAQVLIEKGYTGVDYIACDTDAALLAESNIPIRLQLGNSGIGSGNNPALARDEAIASTDKIIRSLAGETMILFLLASFGGGVGTGCTPVIARIARSLGITTTAVITTPFLFEGIEHIDRALDGIQVLVEEVDSLLVINNEKLLITHPELTLQTAFAKSDLAQAEPVASLSSITVNTTAPVTIDLRQMRDFLGRGGVSFHSVGYARGPGRLTRAIEDALRSPLVADYDIYRAKCVVLFVQYSEQSVAGNGEPQEGLKMDELSEVNRFYDSFSNEIDFYWGLAPDETLGEYVSATIFAGGFSLEDISGMREHIDATTTARDLVRAREEAIRERRRAEFYGLSDPSPLPYRRHAVYIFQPDDLDNPEVIRMVESSPTGRRSPELHAQIVRRSLTPAPQSSTSDSEQPHQHV